MSDKYGLSEKAVAERAIANKHVMGPWTRVTLHIASRECVHCHRLLMTSAVHEDGHFMDSKVYAQSGANTPCEKVFQLQLFA